MTTNTNGSKMARCVNATFSAAIYEWVDVPPKEGCLYSISGYALSRSPETGNLDLVLVLKGFPEICFHRYHFEDVPGPDSPTETGSTQSGLEPISPVESGYPKLVVRLCSAVYQTEAIALEQGEPHVKIGHKSSLVRHPSLRAGSAVLPPVCRLMLLEAVKIAVQRTRFRMCLVWSRGSASFVEADGVVNESDEPPSGGVLVTSNPVF